MESVAVAVTMLPLYSTVAECIMVAIAMAMANPQCMYSTVCNKFVSRRNGAKLVHRSVTHQPPRACGFEFVCVFASTKEEGFWMNE